MSVGLNLFLGWCGHMVWGAAARGGNAAYAGREQGCNATCRELALEENGGGARRGKGMKLVI
jgi:hypothetical protein